ncbi:MAG: phosphate ABC transporter, permease protein PstA [Deltaproteobacteria bacterium RIFCSPHIGHO2_12_FULL_43_9]|nr:MAG: phosphate ABC transporter, permease protein PstA [Deltaproteobacteria bacterium RIFCSPHIGHO2_12_FULL_43_9]
MKSGWRSGRLLESILKVVSLLAVIIPLLILTFFLITVFLDGESRLVPQFLTSYPSYKPEDAGILPALVGSIYLIILTSVIAVPIGVGSAIYLEEYGNGGWLDNLIEINISNLAGVPSILYGLLGLELFVRALSMGRSLLAGAFTMALLVLPIVITASREALRAVPSSLREASYALGASRWETIWQVVLPMSASGILTGVILSVCRAMGETAPLIFLGALTYLAFLPDSPMSPFTALPIQIFNWISRPQAGFAENAAAGIVVLMVVLLLLNGIAIYFRNKMQKRI